MLYIPRHNWEIEKARYRLYALGCADLSFTIDYAPYMPTLLMDAMVNPPTEKAMKKTHDKWSRQTFLNELDNTLRGWIAADWLSMAHLSRYRMLITAEKVAE